MKPSAYFLAYLIRFYVYILILFLLFFLFFLFIFGCLFFQASVPFGVMLGYIVASLVTEFAKGSDVCYYILCWRWPFLIEVALITPLSLILTIIPKNIISVKVIHGNHDKKKQKLKMQLQLQTQINLRSISLNSFLILDSYSHGDNWFQRNCKSISLIS